METWSPWFGEVLNEISDNRLRSKLVNEKPEFIEDARDYVINELGHALVVDHLAARFSDHKIRFHHGTRLTEHDARLVHCEGLKPLIVRDRAEVLKSIFSKHDRWPEVQDRFDQVLTDHGPSSKYGRREDGCVYACFSRAALLRGCTHYLARGAEVDDVIAKTLFADELALNLLTRAGRAVIFSFSVPFGEALAAADPYGVNPKDLPSVINIFLGAWAYKQANPEFEVSSQRNCAVAKFPRSISASEFDGFTFVDDQEIDFGRA